ncbi:hypothetical protein E3U55_14435 [Filobacillus milosensis]|uniref:Uncharacterized protein n=1 Tax=Filobacillus milosensis TaxID=94137 RepID=A0A4Y8IDW9_9BACI|nr:hypothetical protein [Filobacillus milosensis]TFB14110.1 hypothetical protein E3U55_14435 [Filobacillus milosensis]
MKKTEWIIFALLILMGLCCLTVSGTAMWGPGSIQAYFKTFLHLCMWMGLPIIFLGIVYLVIVMKRQGK